MQCHLVTTLLLVLSSADTATDCVDCPDYVQASAAEKQQRLWAKIEGSEYDKLPNEWVGIFSANAMITSTAWNGTISQTFDRFSDQTATNHMKSIHTHGSVASVRLEPVTNDLGLTGHFSGSDYGVIRLSLVKDPNAPCEGTPFTEGCFAPGLALKMLRNGTYSNNLIAMPVLGEGQGRNFNFFKNQMKIWVPTPSGVAAAIVTKIFSYAAQQPTHLGSKEFAAESSTVSDPAATPSPTNVYFVPPADLSQHFSSDPHEFRDDLAEIAVGTHLYDMVVPTADCLCDYDEPCMDIVASCSHVTVGRLVTTSRFVASAWGDQGLFFQHERFEKKQRRVCRFADGLADDEVYRMAGQLDSDCRTDSCPSEAATSWESAVSCPFTYNVIAAQLVV